MQGKAFTILKAALPEKSDRAITGIGCEQSTRSTLQTQNHRSQAAGFETPSAHFLSVAWEETLPCWGWRALLIPQGDGMGENNLLRKKKLREVKWIGENQIREEAGEQLRKKDRLFCEKDLGNFLLDRIRSRNSNDMQQFCHKYVIHEMKVRKNIPNVKPG